jgi:stage V sporulation protein AC
MAQNKKPNISDVINEQNQQKRDQNYNEYVKSKTPKHSWFANACKAFLVGGIICTIGQFFLNMYKNMGFSKDNAALYNVITLVLLSVLLTGFNIYPKIAKFGGAGTIVPITGFANSVAAPAIEYKREGQVFGIGCKIFTIAGPVILYGIFSSWILGICYYVIKLI